MDRRRRVDGCLVSDDDRGHDRVDGGFTMARRSQRRAEPEPRSLRVRIRRERAFVRRARLRSAIECQRGVTGEQVRVIGQHSIVAIQRRPARSAEARLRAVAARQDAAQSQPRIDEGRPRGEGALQQPFGAPVMRVRRLNALM